MAQGSRTGATGIIEIAVLILLALGVWAKAYFFGISTPRGWAELWTLRKDPMAHYEPPNAKRRDRDLQAATTKDDFGHDEETEIRTEYETRERPSRAVASAIKAADAAGWRFIEATCEVADKRIRVSFDKRLTKDSTSQLSIFFTLPDGPFTAQYPRLSILLWRPDYELHLASKPQTRQNIKCLDGLSGVPAKR